MLKEAKGSSPSRRRLFEEIEKKLFITTIEKENDSEASDDDEHCLTDRQQELERDLQWSSTDSDQELENDVADDTMDRIHREKNPTQRNSKGMTWIRFVNVYN